MRPQTSLLLRIPSKPSSAAAADRNAGSSPFAARTTPRENKVVMRDSGFTESWSTRNGQSPTCSVWPSRLAASSTRRLGRRNTSFTRCDNCSRASGDSGRIQPLPDPAPWIRCRPASGSCANHGKTPCIACDSAYAWSTGRLGQAMPNTASTISSETGSVASCPASCGMSVPVAMRFSPRAGQPAGPRGRTTNRLAPGRPRRCAGAAGTAPGR